MDCPTRMLRFDSACAHTRPVTPPLQLASDCGRGDVQQIRIPIERGDSERGSKAASEESSHHCAGAGAHIQTAQDVAFSRQAFEARFPHMRVETTFVEMKFCLQVIGEFVVHDAAGGLRVTIAARADRWTYSGAAL